MRRVIMTFAFLVCLSLSASAKEWETLKGNNFIIYYRASVEERFVSTVMESAEESFREVSASLGISRYQSWASEQRASIYIYADKEDYVKSGGMGWSHGSALVGSRTIKTYPADQGFFDTLLPHELGHIILHEFVGPYADIPLWFDEGVAMYQEKSRRMGAAKMVQEALEKGQFIPLTALTDMRLYSNSDQATVDLFYAESASVVNFMITQLGESRFHRLCRELKENTRFVDALPKIYMYINNLDDLNKKWVNHLKERS